MHKFTFKYVGDGEETWEKQGEGKYAIGAFDNLIDNLKQFLGVEIEDENKVEILECALTAVASPNTVVERRDFSTPESNFDLIYENEK